MLEGIIEGFKQSSAEILGGALAWCIGYLIVHNRERVLGALSRTFRSVAALVKYTLLLSVAVAVLLGGYEVYKYLKSIEVAKDAGTLYERGLEYYEAENYPEALKWYRLAAEQGLAEAQYALGVIYESRLAIRYGTIPDSNKARKWNQKAAEQGNVAAQKALERMEFMTPTFNGIG